MAALAATRPTATLFTLSLASRAASRGASTPAALFPAFRAAAGVTVARPALTEAVARLRVNAHEHVPFSILVVCRQAKGAHAVTALLSGGNHPPRREFLAVDNGRYRALDLDRPGELRSNPKIGAWKNPLEGFTSLILDVELQCRGLVPVAAKDRCQAGIPG